jgi:hypothetical protein
MTNMFRHISTTSVGDGEGAGGTSCFARRYGVTVNPISSAGSVAPAYVHVDVAAAAPAGADAGIVHVQLIP